MINMHDFRSQVYLFYLSISFYLYIFLGWTRKLIEYAKDITDENEDLCNFCKCLENCLQKGLLPCIDNVGYFKVPNAWYWLEYVAQKNYR